LICGSFAIFHNLNGHDVPNTSANLFSEILKTDLFIYTLSLIADRNAGDIRIPTARAFQIPTTSSSCALITSSRRPTDAAPPPPCS
jgi:hypothetical protein